MLGDSRRRGRDVGVDFAQETNHKVVVVLGFDGLWLRLRFVGTLGEELANISIVGVTFSLLFLAGLLG